MLIVLISVSVVAAGFAYGYFKQRSELNKLGDLHAKYNTTRDYADSVARKNLELEEKAAYLTLQLSRANGSVKDLEKKLATQTNGKTVKEVANPVIAKPAVVYGENHPPKKNRRRPNKNKDNKQK